MTQNEPLILHVLLATAKEHADVTDFGQNVDPPLEEHLQGLIAICLELDLVAEGETPRQVIDDLCDVIRCQYFGARESSGRRGFFVPSPKPDWELMSQATVVGSRDLDLHYHEEPNQPEHPALPAVGMRVRLQEFRTASAIAAAPLTN